MTTCHRCGRSIRNPVIAFGVAYGGTCARQVAGSRPLAAKRQRSRPFHVKPKAQDLQGQRELFEEQT